MATRRFFYISLGILALSIACLFAARTASAHTDGDIITMYVGVVSANVRKEPTTSSAIAGHLQRGAEVTVRRQSSDWFQIITPISGFIHTSLLLPNPPPAPRPPIIGATRDSVIARFSGPEWTRNYRYESNVDANAVKFEGRDLLVIVDFNSRGIAEGVGFLTQGPTLSMADDFGGCYVRTHLKDLLTWARGKRQDPYEFDTTGCEVYIGRTHL